ncbi:MAG: GAF domain-containing protein [Steroidobacteraceae bacterium]
MQKPQTPPDEPERQAALERTGALGPGRNADLQDIVELAARICGVPIAVVSLLDRDRQFFKARVGLEAQETPRDVSFCGHAILGTGPFVVSDATQDERFADNPLVTGPPNVRFYAGVPLFVDERYPVGTLCVIDRQPRELDERMRDSLERLARIARLHLQELADRSRHPR